METYPINRGIGRSVEFQGLKSQYLFIFAGGLLALFVLFVILYMAEETGDASSVDEVAGMAVQRGTLHQPVFPVLSV